jgi:hypothetical protein
MFDEQPFLSMQSLSERICIPLTTVYQRLTNFIIL